MTDLRIHPSLGAGAIFEGAPMPIPSLVVTLIALTASSATGGIGAQPSAGTRDMVATSTAAPAVGPQSDDGATTTRRINVAMEDHRFSPSTFDVRVGDTVTFVFTNFGRAVHDAFIGDKAAQEQHENEMRQAEGDGHAHDHAHEGGVTVSPGQSGTLQYTFHKAGALEIGCHQPGHYAAGMIATLNVNPA
jgi:uncharacterized cupredoxin-like copper-binding protein